MISILWLHRKGIPARDVYGGESQGFAQLRVGDVFRYHDRFKTHDAHYFVSARNVTISGSRVELVLQCTECAPPDEIAH